MNHYFKYLDTSLPTDILAYKLNGNLKKATELIDKRLKDDNLSESLKGSLLVQKQIIKRIPHCYKYTFDEALQKIQNEIPDFTAKELQDLLDERAFEWAFIDGKIHVVNDFFDTIKRNKEIAKRCKNYVPEKMEDVRAYNVYNAMNEDGYMAQTVKIKTTLKLNDDKFEKGLKYLVHISIPKNCSIIKDVKIEEVYPKTGIIDDNDAPQRTVFWEETMEENHEFYVVYSYVCVYKYMKLDKPGVNKQYDFDLKEEYPHIVFTPYIKQITEEITKGINDPLLKAKAIYDFITINMKYAYQPSYFLKDNIPETCLKLRRGDCGVFALTFITLCRCVGIPARWESGLVVEEKGISSHDWCKFYVEPYGWIYADPSFAIGAVGHDFPKGREYYFGNLDCFRMVANSEFQKEFTKPKKYFRSDPYDNQGGEIESEKQGFIDNVDYKVKIEPLVLDRIKLDI